MKHDIRIIMSSLLMAMMVVLSGCHEPDESLPPVSRNGINSLTASFPDGSGEFTAVVEEGSNEIIIYIPYFYPEDSDNQITENMLKKMKVKANLDDNVIVEPALNFMDLTKENMITVIDQVKERKQYVVRSEIVKSDKAKIESFSLPKFGLTGIINDTDGTISFVTMDDLSESTTAELTLSYHASVSPDPRVESLSYEKGQEFVVTAHDGITKKVYKVLKSVPEKLQFGLRPESAKVMFAKKLNEDLGIPDGTSKGIALSGNYLAINSNGYETIYIDAKTGEKVGSFDLGALKGGNKNWYHTSDDDGNILISNRITDDGNTFRMYKMSSVDATPELFIEWTPNPAIRLGRSKFSINGSLNSNAIITVPFNPSRNTKFARWQVVNGALVSNEPDIVEVDMKVTGHRTNPYESPSPGRGWDNNVDIKYSSSTSLTSDYFITNYGDDLLSWVNGNTNVQTDIIHINQADFVSNSLDLIEFNNATYVATNLISGTNSNNADVVWIVDATNNVNFNKGTLWNGTSPAIVWQCPRGTYGARSFGGPKNDNFGSDILFKTSEDGYFLYLYFMFNNGYVVGYQFDCVKM